MPPYLRKNLFRGWDWFTPRSLRHLPWQEQERFIEQARQAVRRLPHFWLFGYAWPLVVSLAMALPAFGDLLGMSSLIYLPLSLFCIVSMVVSIVWQRKRFTEALRKLLFEANIRPWSCFECGYNLEGYEGRECPACDSVLLGEGEVASP